MGKVRSKPAVRKSLHFKERIPEVENVEVEGVERVETAEAIA